MILAAVIVHRSFLLLNEAIEVSGRKSYPNVVAHFFGRKVGKFYAYMFFISGTMISVVFTTIGKPFDAVTPSLEFLRRAFKRLLPSPEAGRLDYLGL